MLSRLPCPFAAVGVILSAGTVVSAQGPIRATPIRSPRAVTAEVLKPIEDSPGAFLPLRGNTRGATIFGVVQNHIGELVPLAGIIRVRSLIDGRIIGEVKVDNLAQFSLRGFDPGLYAAELVDEDTGGIRATTPAFSAGVGEVIQLAPVIPVNPVSGFGSSARKCHVGRCQHSCQRWRAGNRAW